MHIFVLVCGILSTILVACVGIPYILTIVRKQTKPHQFSWLIYTIVNGVNVVSQYLAGGRLSVLVYVMFFIYSATYFLLSLKFGVRDSSRFDRLLLVSALLTIIIWILTRNNSIAIWLTIVIDTFPTTMLILKIRKHPGSEPFGLWFIATLAVLFSCLSLLDKPFSILYIRPAYSLLSDIALLAAIVYFQPKANGHVIAQPNFPEV